MCPEHEKPPQGPISACIPGKPAGWLAEPNCQASKRVMVSDQIVLFVRPLLSFPSKVAILRQGSLVASDAGDHV